jgi:hypothetical protein
MGACQGPIGTAAAAAGPVVTAGSAVAMDVRIRVDRAAAVDPIVRELPS